MRYEIEWLDSGLNRVNGWETLPQVLSETGGLCTVKTLGYLIHEDEDAYFFAHSKTTTLDKFYGIQVIAKKNIIKMSPMRER
jgi:hypothetical protein